MSTPEAPTGATSPVPTPAPLPVGLGSYLGIAGAVISAGIAAVFALSRGDYSAETITTILVAAAFLITTVGGRMAQAVVIIRAKGDIATARAAAAAIPVLQNEAPRLDIGLAPGSTANYITPARHAFVDSLGNATPFDPHTGLTTRADPELDDPAHEDEDEPGFTEDDLAGRTGHSVVAHAEGEREAYERHAGPRATDPPQTDGESAGA